MSHLEDLQDQYHLHQKLRDGTMTMAQAFVVSEGKRKGAALHNVQSGYMECLDTMCSIEHQIEEMMGSFLFQIKGILSVCMSESKEFGVIFHS